jgi:CheY-like chemotaxis protein
VLRRSLQLRLLNKCGVKYDLAENGQLAVEIVTAAMLASRPTADLLAAAQVAAELEEDKREDAHAARAEGASACAAGDGDDADAGADWRERAEQLARDIVSYDLIIMDNQMPVMTGEQATRALRALGYHGTIVGMTGDPTGSADRAEFEAAGLNACFDKDSKAIECLHGVIRSFAIDTAEASPAELSVHAML